MPQSPTGTINRSKNQPPINAKSTNGVGRGRPFREDQIAMVYHDLRSPLSNIIFSLEVLSSLAGLSPGRHGAIDD